MSETKSSSQRLHDEVIKRGLCTLCGSCVGLCPYFQVNPRRGTIQQMDPCDLHDGRCYAFCPRASLDLDALNQAVFGKPYTAIDIGEVRNVMMARSLDEEVRGRAQYGGVVTTLLIYALKNALIDAAVTTKSVDFVPQAVIVTNRQEVLQCSGSNYMVCPVLETFSRAADDPVEKIGVVGVPCQMQALAKRRIAGFEDRNNIGKLTLSIGLFCTWALDRSFLEFIGERVLPAKVERTDIPPPPASEFQLWYAGEGYLSIPLTDVKRFVPQACQFCVDMTAEYADLSVGSVEGIEGWNTVIIRSKIGSDLLEAAEKAGLLEVKSLPVENIGHLREASLIKKRRAVNRIMEWTGSKHDLGYLRIKPKTLDSLLKG